MIVFLGILEYIYSDKLELNEELAMDLLGISDQYLLKDLRKACEEYLVGCLRVEILAKRIEEAEIFGAGILKEGILEFIVENLEEVDQYSERDEIPKEIIMEVIMSLYKKS